MRNRHSTFAVNTSTTIFSTIIWSFKIRVNVHYRVTYLFQLLYKGVKRIEKYYGVSQSHTADVSCVRLLFIAQICGPISYTFGFTKFWVHKITRVKKRPYTTNFSCMSHKTKNFKKIYYPVEKEIEDKGTCCFDIRYGT